MENDQVGSEVNIKELELRLKQTEFQLKEIELELKRRERDEKLSESKFVRFLKHYSFLSTAGAAMLGLLVTGVGYFIQSSLNRNLERERLQGQLILKAIETGKQQEAAQNLRFLFQSRLIYLSEDQVKQIDQVAGPAILPVLPATNAVPATGLDVTSLLDVVSLPEGKRKQTVQLALDLQARKIPFLMGGRSPERGGLDLSGFIDYLLSQPQISIIKNPENCNQECLKGATTPTKALEELKPGDLIFYDYNYTMMYLGRGKCIGMMFQGTIEVKDVNFGEIKGLGKVPYGD
jgi:cell wall-associated NlpC family hydrolase